VTYIHEETPFLDALAKIFTILGKPAANLWNGLETDDEDAIIQSSFLLRYTIPRTILKDIIMQSPADFREMMDQVTGKAKPDIKISVTEQKVCSSL
jgi:hypothetical protein